GADVGHRIRSRVIASNAEGTASANSNATPGVVQPSSTGGPPANSSPPTISGTPQQNQTLAASTGSWQGAQPQTYSYQWRRFHVSDSQGHPVQGALVFVVGIPFGNTTTPPEQATGSDGWVTFVIRPTFRLRLSANGNQPFFVRARKATDRLIAGVSTRRLVNLSIRAG